MVTFTECLDYDHIVAVILLLEETRVPGKTTDLQQVTDKFYHIML
jgi:hypothetical protein